VHRGPSWSPPPACRCTAAWASSRRPAPAQHQRDARITTIYEGTTGIQANDLIGRKRLAAGADNADFLRAKLLTARFYAEQILPRAQMHAEAVQAGAQTIMAFDEAML
jgi:hypothetical protein